MFNIKLYRCKNDGEKIEQSEKTVLVSLLYPFLYSKKDIRTIVHLYYTIYIYIILYINVVLFSKLLHNTYFHYIIFQLLFFFLIFLFFLQTVFNRSQRSTRLKNEIPGPEYNVPSTLGSSIVMKSSPKVCYTILFIRMTQQENYIGIKDETTLNCLHLFILYFFSI